MTHSVLIVEDDPHLRAMFSRAVRCTVDLRVAGEADDLHQGMRLLEATRPSVLLVDIGLPTGSGLQLIRHATRHVRTCSIMVVTVFAEEQLVVDCIEAGAIGYLLKDSSSHDIASQIRLLLAGGSPISPTIARGLLRRMACRSYVVEAAPNLSAQEHSVLSLSTKGYSYDEIARLLNISRHTVGTYVKRAYKKLQVHSKSQAVYEARKLGIVSD